MKWYLKIGDEYLVEVRGNTYLTSTYKNHCVLTRVQALNYGAELSEMNVDFDVVIEED